MQVFKCALKLALRRPAYFIIYGLGLSLMAVFIAGSLATPTPQGEYKPYDCDFAVIDRDASPVSASMEEMLRSQGTQVPLEDSELAMQDAVAKGAVSYILVIPDGYGEDFRQAAVEGRELPEMECIYSYYSAEGSLVDAALSDYASSLAAFMKAMPDASVEEAIRLAKEASDVNADVQMIPRSDGAALTDQFVFFLQFDMYVYFAGVIVCVGLMLCSFNRTDVRRRNFSSPVSYMSYSLQTGLACVALTLVFWALTVVLGIACFPESFGAIPVPGKLLVLVVPALFALIPLGVAFMLGQTNTGEMTMNAFGNILGLVLSFFGGVWIPLDLMSSQVVSIAHLLPGFWYTDALSRAANFDGSTQALAAIGVDMGVIVLFAVAVFAAGMAIGRMRRQTSDAGGNAAAEIAIA